MVGARLGVSRGLDIAGARVDPAVGEADFLYADAAVEANQAIGKRVVLRAAATGRWTRDRLPAAQRFSVGGASFGRAFDDGLVSGDRGYAGFGELALRPLAKGALAKSEVYAFADYADVTLLARPATSRRPVRSGKLGRRGAPVLPRQCDDRGRVRPMRGTSPPPTSIRVGASRSPGKSRSAPDRRSQAVRPPALAGWRRLGLEQRFGDRIKLAFLARDPVAQRGQDRARFGAEARPVGLDAQLGPIAVIGLERLGDMAHLVDEARGEFGKHRLALRLQPRIERPILALQMAHQRIAKHPAHRGQLRSAAAGAALRQIRS